MFLSWLSNLRCSAILFFAAFVLLFNAAGVLAASDVSRAHDRPLRLAIVNTYGQILSDMYYGESLKKIREAIAPRPLEIRIYGPDTFLDAARSNQFDMSIASYGLTSIMLRQTGGARVLTAVNNRFPNPYAGNGAAIIVRSDRKDINTFEDLPGKSLGVMSITAFAGWQVPMAELTSMGIDVKRAFRDIKVVGEPMTQILDLVYRGEADVGFVVNCLLEDVQALGKYKEEDFKVIGDRGLRSGSSCKHSTRLYPNWSFSIKPQMSPDESKAVVMALLSIPASEDISVHWTLTPDGTGADTVFQQLNLPYAEAYGLRDLLLEYSGVAFGVLAVGLVLVVNIVVLTVAVRIRTKQKEKALAEKMQSDLDARRAALKLRTMEKLSAVGTLSSMAAHELKQPLTVVNNYAGSLRRRLMRSDVPREVLIDALTEIEESGLKAAEVIDLVRGYATNKERTFVRTDLAMNARSVCRSYCRRTQRDNSRIGKDTFMVEMGSLHDASDAQQPHVPIVRVVDDDDKVRRSWQFVLEGEGWQVQAYESAVRFLQEDDPSIPGCIVCDVRMPEMSGIELQTEMKRTGNTMPLVLISAHADLVMAVKAVKDGAYDFLLKPVETERLIQTVSEALELDQTRREESAEDDRVRRSWDLLSAREKEVARGVADGKLNKQIAYDLNISEKTVIAHRSSLCRKLGIRSAADITRMLLTIEKLEKDQSKKETAAG